jgi:tetratricopeptide (TPR) repeat protein
LHRRILAALEASCPGREEDVVEELCRHAVQAQDWVKADRYGYAAAKKALAKSAFRDATNCFEIAIDAVDKQPTSAMREQRAVDLRIEARMAYSPFGRTAEWLDLCRDAEARSEQIGDQSRRLASLAVRAAALNSYGTPFEAITTGEAAVTLAQELSNTTWRSFADYGLGQAYFLAGRYRDAELRFESALKRLTSGSENVPPGTTGTSLRVICYMMKAITHGWLGEFDSSAVCSKRAGELAAGSGLSYDKIAAGYCRGLIQMFRGNFDEAESILAEAVSLARDNEVRLFLPLVTCALGNVYVQRGLQRKRKTSCLRRRPRPRS